jgi:phenylpropionate dioxygenase-like ring-hydroxylating dioxygenase large terminal subunit
VSTAPLDLDEVRACLSGSGTMLPRAAYTDESVLNWERRALFAGGWMCVGRSSELAEPRARRAVRTGDDAVLLVRGEDGVLRGFYNVCRHRGHEILPCDGPDSGPSAGGRFIACPYHSWTYDLDGRLHRVPAADRADITPDRQAGLGLVGVAVAEWQGFVFVNADGSALPFDAYVTGLDELLAPYELDRLVVAASHDYVMAANWKLAVENYHECYHCSTIHPELCRVSSPESGVNYNPGGMWVGGTMELMDGVETMALDGRSRSTPIRGVTGDRLRDVTYLQLFPNLLLSVHPDYVMTHVLDPVAPDRTAVVCEWLFPPEAVTVDGFDPSYAVDFWDITNKQDWAACEGVQRGVSSRGYRPGPLSPWHEDAVFQAIAIVGRAYLDGRLPTSAPAVTSTRKRNDSHVR